jgi:hypothetical protein
MSNRREFTKPVYAEIVKRAMHPKLGLCCEGCGLVLGKRKHHVDHTIADALQIDKSRKLTADDGKLLGVECCHKPKTVEDVGAIAKAKRVEANYHGFAAPKQKIPGRGFPVSQSAAKRQTKIPLPPRFLYLPTSRKEKV